MGGDIRRARDTRRRLSGAPAPRQQEKDEEYERRRAERHARRRERRESRREKESRSESAPPSRPRPPQPEKYTSSSPQLVNAYPAARPQPAQHWAPPGPPPPIQYTPQSASMSPRLPARQTQSISPPTVPIAPPRIPPPPISKPPQPGATTSTPAYAPAAVQSQYYPPALPQHHNGAAHAPYTTPQAAYSQPSLPPNAYEMSGGEIPQQYLYANGHTPELRTPSPPIGEGPAERPILRTGERRARSNSRVRFALPLDGDEGRLVEVAPGDAPSQTPVSPPPPYRP